MVMWANVLTLTAETFRDFARNNCSYFAAGIAYWALLSLFPLVLAAISLVGFLYPSPEEQSEIVEGVIKLIPVSGSYLSEVVADVVHARGVLGLLAVTGLLFSGAKVFASVRRGINQAWNIRFQHPFFVARAIDLVLLLAAAFLVFMTVLLTTIATGLSIPIDTPEVPGARLVAPLLSELLALTVTLGIFILLYRYIPNTRVTWRDVWLGALVGSVLLNGFRIGLTWFIATFSGFNLLYGSLGALIAVLVWVYMSSLALMWGAQVAATYSRLFGTLAEAGSEPREA